MDKIVSITKAFKSNFKDNLLYILALTKESLGGFFSFLNYPYAEQSNALDFSNKEDYLFLPEEKSIKKHLRLENLTFAVLLFVALVTMTLLIQSLFHLSFWVIISGAVTLFYLCFTIFKIIVMKKSLTAEVISFTRQEIAGINDEELPIYTLLIPLKDESEVIGQIKKAMTSIDYPSDKIDAIVTVEEYDFATRTALKQAKLPSCFKILVLPDVKPKTKPKALNVALLEAQGVFLVIYDAEIIPDPDQLKKAYLAFKKYPELKSLQPKLDHYNADNNIITRLFNAEFAFYYDYFLPGLQKMNMPIPLSGHSTHFRTDVLRELGGWDPYNVTEDCDMGMRLASLGYKTAIFDSISQEEATSTLGDWIPQRTRWLKGFIQTTLVHMRYPVNFLQGIGGWTKLIGFFFSVPGTIILNLVNLFSWVLFILLLSPYDFFVEKFFPGPILYFSFTTSLIAILVFTYMNLIAIFKRKRHSLVKYSLLTPIYWILLVIATVRSLHNILIKPHSWEKTKHGSHLLKQNENQISS